MGLWLGWLAVGAVLLFYEVKGNIPRNLERIFALQMVYAILNGELLYGSSLNVEDCFIW